MSRIAAIAASSLCLALLSGAAAAGDWRHHHHHRVVEVAQIPWYHQQPWIGTGPGTYYSHYPDHIPAYPKPLTGYPVPIYDTNRPVLHGMRQVAFTTHLDWCAVRYRSYDFRTDTYQPHHGPRRQCRSPYR